MDHMALTRQPIDDETSYQSTYNVLDGGAAAHDQTVAEIRHLYSIRHKHEFLCKH